MPCASCGKKKTNARCVLCGLTSNEFYSWGTDKKICWRCNKKMKTQLENAKYNVYRIQLLLAGKNPKPKGKIKL